MDIDFQEENCQTFQNSSWNSIDTKEELITEELVKENEKNVLNCHKCESCGISFSVEQHRKNPYKFTGKANLWSAGTN